MPKSIEPFRQWFKEPPSSRLPRIQFDLFIQVCQFIFPGLSSTRDPHLEYLTFLKAQNHEAIVNTNESINVDFHKQPTKSNRKGTLSLNSPHPLIQGVVRRQIHSASRSLCSSFWEVDESIDPIIIEGQNRNKERVPEVPQKTVMHKKAWSRPSYLLPEESTRACLIYVF